MIIRQKRIIITFIIIFVTLYFNIFATMALEVETHSAINKQIAQSLFLDDYLKKQLGMGDGRDTFLNNKKVFDIIADGGVLEDNFLRYSNHFYNPLNDQGLFSIFISAKDWALKPAGNQYADGQYSWFDARDYYYKALTSKDKAARDTNFAETFRAIGQVMHLIQDMSVPAHVRNDAHGLKGDGYELWAKRNIKDGTQVNAYTFQAHTPYNSSFLILNLFDTGQYDDDSNPTVTLSNSVGLSEFTNSNFLSAKTIFRHFTYPNWSNLQAYEQDMGSGKTVVYQRKTGPLPIEHFVREKIYYNLLPSTDAFRGLRLDDYVHADYAQYLIPRAIGYSSQVLSYFFRGQLDAVFGDGNIKIKNVSSETISNGTFEIYSDNADGRRTLLSSAQANTIANGAEQIIPFNSPEDASSYMLVYKGQLGSESGAVIGKFIPVESVVIHIRLHDFPTTPERLQGGAYAKSVAFVWNPTTSSPRGSPMVTEIAPSGQIVFDDAVFQTWYNERTVVGKEIFGLLVECGLEIGQAYSFAGSKPSECGILIPNMFDSVNINTVETIIGYFDPEHFGEEYPITNVKGTQNKDIKAVTRHLYRYPYPPYDPQYRFRENPFPKSFYRPINIPNSPVAATGVRTHVISSSKSEATQMAGTPQFIYGGSSTSSLTYKFYSAFGEITSFSGNYKTKIWQKPASGSQGPWDMTHSEDNFIPQWVHRLDPTWPGIWTPPIPFGREYFDCGLAGQYSETTLVNITWVQFSACSSDVITDAASGSSGDAYAHYTFGPRSVAVHAQAKSVPNVTTGYNWIAAGRSKELETQVIAAINAAYNINGIPPNEVRDISMTINIVK